MDPAGTTRPLIYVLGEAPGETEDKRGVPFVGAAAQVLKVRIPEKYLSKIRWNNCVRSMVPKNRLPNATQKLATTTSLVTKMEIECCRPSIVRDIQETKPKVIFGFGNVPLDWALSETHITKWSGKFIPVKIGTHLCWFFPFLHPSYVMKGRKYNPRDPKGFGSDDELAFAFDLKRALRMADKMPDPVVHTREDVFANIEYVTGSGHGKDVEKVRAFIRSLDDPAITVGVDYETNRLRPYNKGAKILTMAIATKDKSFSFPLDHRESQWTDKERDQIDDEVHWFLNKARCRKIVHKLGFELEWSGVFYGRKTLRASQWECSMAQAYILDERRGVHSLEFLSVQYFSVNIKKETGFLDRKNLDKEDLVIVLKYNAVDAKYHRLLYYEQKYWLEKDPDLLALYKRHLRRIPTVVLTQMKGIPVDQAVVSRFEEEHNKALDRVEEELKNLPVVVSFRKETGLKFLPTKPKQVNQVFKKLGYYDLDSLDAAVLKGIDEPFAKLILQHRHHSKILSTYVEPLRVGSPDLFEDGLIHPIISTEKVETSRTSSEAPNSQNFPMRENKEVRSQIAHPDKNIKVVSFDYAGIQARNVAMESLDKGLIKSYWERYDIHSDWRDRIVKAWPQWGGGAEVFKADKDLAKHYRYRAKNQFVFPSFFGAQAKKLSAGLEIPEDVTKELREEFFTMFPDIHAWHEDLAKQLKTQGYVNSLAGYRRRAPCSSNEMINAPIQADEAAIVLNAMERISLLGWEFQPSMEIHDDLTFFWRKDEIKQKSEIVVKEMVSVPFKWAQVVPIQVEMLVGDDWASKKEIGAYSSDDWDGTIKYDPEGGKP